MAAMNVIATSAIFQKQLDAQIIQNLLTGWMDSNAGQVQYNGGKEVKVPKMSTTGMGNYTKADGNRAFAYSKGKVTFEYETFTMTQDRGTSFELDARDVDETNFVLSAGLIMGEFQRTQVVPEVDAYRIAKLAEIATGIAGDKNAEYGYAPAKDTILEKIKTGYKVIRDAGYQGTIITHISYDAKLELEMALAGNLRTMTWSVGGIDTEVPSIDGNPLIETPENRMYSAITLNDGSTEYGYKKATTGKTINFVMAPANVPIAVTKLDNMRIFDPQTYQLADAWAMDYRRHHDMWIMDNKKAAVYVNIKEAKGTTLLENDFSDELFLEKE